MAIKRTIPLLATVLVVLGAPVRAHEIVVTPRRILLHGDFIPRFSNLPRVLVVPKGRTVTLPPSSRWDAIEVAGTLRVARTRDTVVSFTHLLILPGGTLDVGTADDPIPCGFRVTLTVRDVPIDVENDPYQWGNGIINLGHQSRVGCAKSQAWTELAEDVEAGAVTIRLTVPAGWQVGDELFLPDFRQMDSRRDAAPVRRESPVAIAAIDGDLITLSKPLDFEHRSITSPDGVLVARPRVANLTRNIVVRSENPTGTRGHTANVGPATWDIRYSRLEGLGRTQNVDLASATELQGKVVPGTNQVARYASHDHHVMGAGVHQFIGNVLVALSDGVTSKWGHSTHGTHDTLVEENIALDFPGAGFVTEDGYESRNVYRRNVAAGSIGNGRNPSTAQCPGCEGAGFWFRGLHGQVIEQNEAWNNFIGLDLFTMNTIDGQYPSQPGGMPDTDLDEGESIPASVSRNVTLSNVSAGLEFWSTARFPVDDHVAAHNGQKQVFVGQSTNNHSYLRNLTAVAQGGTTDGVSSSEAYVTQVEVDGGYIGGCFQAFQRGIARQFARVRNITLQCAHNFYLWGSINVVEDLTFENVLHKDLEGFPRSWITLTRGEPWQPGQPLPFQTPLQWTPGIGASVFIRNWQGTGQDYRLFTNQQRAELPAIPAMDGQSRFACPIAGATMGECWKRYNHAFLRGVVWQHEAVVLEGTHDALAAPGLDTPMGPPVAVVTFPNMMTAAIVTNGRTRVSIALQGAPTAVADTALVQIDRGPVMRMTRGLGQLPHTLEFDSHFISPGTHTIRTWRENDRGQPIAESSRTYRYFVAR
jgi:hypothetical protein